MGWLKKGASDKVKKTMRLRKIWDDMIKEYARRTGQTQIAVIEKLLAYGDKSFRAEHGLGYETDERETEDREEAVNLAGKQLTRRGQQTSEERYMRSILFDYQKPVDVSRLEPRDIWDRLLKRRRETDWIPVE